MNWKSTQLTEGPVPLWFQIAERLRAAIAAGEFKAGDTLPSEAELLAAFGVSRTTARASLEKLRQDGLISRRPGRGSIMLKPKVEQPVNQLASFSEDMRQRGLAATYETVGAAFMPAPDEVAAALGLAPASEAFCGRRVLKADGEPVGFSIFWLAPSVLEDRSPPTIAELDAGSLYAWLARHCGAQIAGAQEYIEAALADGEIADRLDVPRGSALLVARRRSHAADSSPIEYAVMHYRADRYRFSIDLVRP